MPVSFLSTTQRECYGRYPEALSSEELARYFVTVPDSASRVELHSADHGTSIKLDLATALLGRSCFLDRHVRHRRRLGENNRQ